MAVGWRRASANSPSADHAHDLDHVARVQQSGRVGIAVDDHAVELDGDRLRVDAELIQVGQQGSWRVELDVTAVDSQRDHKNILIAA